MKLHICIITFGGLISGCMNTDPTPYQNSQPSNNIRIQKSTNDKSRFGEYVIKNQQDTREQSYKAPKQIISNELFTEE